MSAGLDPRCPFRLLAITPPQGAVAPGIVRAWAAAREHGVAVLLREPGTAPDALLDPHHRLAELRRACADAGLACVLSTDAAGLDMAAAAVAEGLVAGVQLRGDPPPRVRAAARAALGPSVILGRSCHGQPDPCDAVDYSVLAPIFAPRTPSPDPDAPPKVAVGLDPLRWLCARQPRVFALGGVTPARAAACIAAGAYGIAGIRTFFGPSEEVAHNVAHLATSWTSERAEVTSDAAAPR